MTYAYVVAMWWTNMNTTSFVISMLEYIYDPTPNGFDFQLACPAEIWMIVVYGVEVISSCVK